MNLKFTKMQALGNDFVVLDFTQQSINLSVEQASHIADRHFGVGCDQILIVEKSEREEIDFKYRILNADGSEVGQCGNGARCFVRYIHEKDLSDKNPITVETLSGEMILTAEDHEDMVTVDMGAPQFEPMAIPIDAQQYQDRYQIELDGDSIRFSAVSMGNPHAVIVVDNVCTTDVSRLGEQLETHEMFPERANIGFMQINDRNDISLRVFERGAGETLACGSGACAAVVSGIRLGLLNSEVVTHLSGGDLLIKWAGDDQHVLMTGPAATSFEGTIKL